MLIEIVCCSDVHLDHFIKVVSAKFFYSKLLFSLVIDQYLGGDVLRLCY